MATVMTALDTCNADLRRRWNVDETSAPQDCLVEQTSGIATLDAMTCAIFVKRAKFRPVLDDGGKPVRSIVSTRICWVMR